jgi:hypothetical protein
MSDKKYIKGVYLKEKTFNNGGSLISVSIKVDDFIEAIKAVEQNKGYINLNIEKMRETNERGNTHYVCENTWKPANVVSTTVNTPVPAEIVEDDKDSLPF